MTIEQNDATGIEIQSPSNTKSFLVFFAEQQGGAFVKELSEKLRDLTEALQHHHDDFRGKTTGEIQIKFQITLADGAYKVVTEYGVKYPKAPPAGTMMFLGRDGNLSPFDPRQLAMPFVRPVA